MYKEAASGERGGARPPGRRAGTLMLAHSLEKVKRSDNKDRTLNRTPPAFLVFITLLLVLTCALPQGSSSSRLRTSQHSQPLGPPGPILSATYWRWLSQYSVGDDGAQAVAAVQCLERLDRAGHPREAMRDEVVEHDLALRDRLKVRV